MLYKVRVDYHNYKELHTRRRGGLVFGREPIMVSTSPGDGVEVVSGEALELILADSYLHKTQAGAVPTKAKPRVSKPKAEELAPPKRPRGRPRKRPAESPA